MLVFYINIHSANIKKLQTDNLLGYLMIYNKVFVLVLHKLCQQSHSLSEHHGRLLTKFKDRCFQIFPRSFQC